MMACDEWMSPFPLLILTGFPHFSDRAQCHIKRNLTERF